MSESDDKTEEASPEKLRKAKEEGQVPKSQDFVSSLGFAAGFMALVAMLPFTLAELKQFTVHTLQTASQYPSNATVFKTLQEAIPLILKLSLPIGGAVFVMGIFSNVIQTGFFLAFKAIEPKPEKLNPVSGLKNLFKVKKFVDLVKNVIKVAIASWLAWDIMTDALFDMSLLVTMPLNQSTEYGGKILGEYLVKTMILNILIGGADFLWSRQVFAKEMMMSKHDVKQEYKQMEGDPHTKGERRRLAQELLFSGGPSNVKKADAVVVNPTHIAVAIKYDKDKSKAPTVIAKGMRIHAKKIREIAEENGIPVLRNVPLAHALYKLDIDEEVPEELYEAVAEVLAFVYKIREEQAEREKARRDNRRQAFKRTGAGDTSTKLHAEFDRQQSEQKNPKPAQNAPPARRNILKGDTRSKT